MENYLGSVFCSCGKEHDVAIDDVVVGSGVIKNLPKYVEKYQAKKPFILADCNTYKAAGETVTDILKNCGIAFSQYIYPNANLEPNEEAVGSAFMHFDNTLKAVLIIMVTLFSIVVSTINAIKLYKYIKKEM